MRLSCIFIPLDRGDRKPQIICSPVTIARGEDYE
jgi:hypothetical protein